MGHTNGMGTIPLWNGLKAMFRMKKINRILRLK